MSPESDDVSQVLDVALKITSPASDPVVVYIPEIVSEAETQGSLHLQR